MMISNGLAHTLTLDVCFLNMWSNEFCILQAGETALIWACINRESETVSLLLKAGAKIDIQEEVAIVQSAFDLLATCNDVMLCTEWSDCPLLGCLPWL